MLIFLKKEAYVETVVQANSVLKNCKWLPMHVLFGN